MPEYLDDPSVLTKDKLKSELLAHNVELPSGNPTKDVYVQLYLKNLTVQNHKHVTATTLDAFSSDEELPPPVLSSRSRSSGRKATRKTDKVLPDELDVTLLSDQDLKDQLFKHGMDVGPVVASTRKLYERKLQKLLDDGVGAQPEVLLTEIQVNHNGNSESDLYSDKEDEVTAVPEPEPEPVAEPEPVPVVERPLRSRGKTPVTTRTRSSQHHTPQEAELFLCPAKPRQDSVALLNTALLEKSKSPLEKQSPQAAASPSRLTRVSYHSFSPRCKISPIKKQESLRTLSDQFGSKPGSVSAAGVRLYSDFCGVAFPFSLSFFLHYFPLNGVLLPLKPSRSVAVNSLLMMSRSSVWLLRVSAGTVVTAEVLNTHAVCEQQQSGALPDVLLHLKRQQKITGFLSTCTPVEKIAASEQTPKVEENDVLKELFSNDNSPTGIIATCRRPIKGAAGRPLKTSDLWHDENSLFSPKTTKTSSSSSYIESRVFNRVSSLPPSTSFNSSSSTTTSSFSSSSSRPLSAVPPAGQTKAAQSGMSMWIKLFVLAIVATFLFLVYQAMETNTTDPFGTSGTEVSSGSSA